VACETIRTFFNIFFKSRKLDFLCFLWIVAHVFSNTAGVIMCLGQGADLHMAQLMPLPFAISCSSKSRLVLPSLFSFSGAGSLWTLNWLLILLTARTIQKTVDLSSGSQMPINTDCWLHLSLTCCQPVSSYTWGVLERVFSICGDLTAGNEISWLKAWKKRIILKMNLPNFIQHFLQDHSFTIHLLNVFSRECNLEAGVP